MNTSHPLRICMRNLRSWLIRTAVALPRNVECNLCGWRGRRFLSDGWHEHINCPRCLSEVRHRLFLAALQHIPPLSTPVIIANKRVLHFAPEPELGRMLKGLSCRYVTADYLRQDCDIRIDMSNMPSIGDVEFDVVVAFDVLEHVPDYRGALREVHRILAPNGVAAFTVPQKDHLAKTYEDRNIVHAKDRELAYGQWDHLRIFGDDLPDTLRDHGFDVTVVSESLFPANLAKRHVLFPPRRSAHPLATNFRKVFFCRKAALH